MNGYYADLAAFNIAILAEQYAVYNISLDGAVVKSGVCGPPIEYVTNEHDASIILRPSDYRDDNVWHVFVAGTPTYVGRGNGTIGSVSVDATKAVADTYNIVMLAADRFHVYGTLSTENNIDEAPEPFAQGTVGVAYAGCPLHFTITAGGTAFVSGDHFVVTVR